MNQNLLIGNRELYRFTMPVIDSNMYVLPIGKSWLIIDPCLSRGAGQLLAGCEVIDCLVLLTHEHYDHISGVNWLRERLKCEVVCSKICAEQIKDPKKNSSAYFEALFIDRDEETQKQISNMADKSYSCKADVTYAGRLEFQWNGLDIELGEAPGHSPGSQIIRINQTNYFTGDYLIPGEKVITRLPGGSKRKYEAVTKPYLQDIEPDSMIFPGHGEPSVLSEMSNKGMRILECK